MMWKRSDECDPMVTFLPLYHSWVADCLCGFSRYCDTPDDAQEELETHLGEPNPHSGREQRWLNARPPRVKPLVM